MNLPTYAIFDKQKVFDVLKMDKKRERKEMNYVLLEKIGKGVVKPIPLNPLEKIINDFKSFKTGINHVKHKTITIHPWR